MGLWQCFTNLYSRDSASRVSPATSTLIDYVIYDVVITSRTYSTGDIVQSQGVTSLPCDVMVGA